MHKVIDFCKSGEAIADHLAEQRAREFLLGNETNISVSTCNFILASRALLYEGRFPYDQVTFKHEGNAIRHDADLRFHNWPRGFCDTAEDWLCRLLDPKKGRG